MVNANITGTGSVIYNGNNTSTLTLGNNTNNYTGNTTVLAGTLSIAADRDLGCSTACTTGNTLILGGGNLLLTGAVGPTRNIIVNASGSIIGSNTANLTTTGNITINSGTLSVSGNVSVLTVNTGGNIDMEGGTLAPANGTVVIAGAGTLTGNSGTVNVLSACSSGGFANQYALTGGNNLGNLTVNFANATGSQYVDSLTFGSLMISNTSGTDTSIASGTVTVTRNLTVNSGGCLTAGSGSTVTVGSATTSSTITSSGNLSLVNLTVPASANVTDSGSFTVSGTMTVNGSFGPAAGTTNTITNSGGAASVSNTGTIVSGGTVNGLNLSAWRLTLQPAPHPISPSWPPPGHSTR